MTKPMAAVAGLMLLEQRRSPLQAKLADYYPVFADMKVGMPQADGSLKLGAQVSPIYIHDLYRVRFAQILLQNRHTDGAGRLVHFLKPSIVTRWIVRATYARLY